VGQDRQIYHRLDVDPDADSDSYSDAHPDSDSDTHAYADSGTQRLPRHHEHPHGA
jgi:hypothetical protein